MKTDSEKIYELIKSIGFVYKSEYDITFYGIDEKMEYLKGNIEFLEYKNHNLKIDKEKRKIDIWGSNTLTIRSLDNYKDFLFTIRPFLKNEIRKVLISKILQ